MKFCPVVPEICRGQVHASRKERRIRIIIIIIRKIKIIIRNRAKIISLQTLFGRLNYHEQYIQLKYRNLSKLGISQANSLLAW
jgi:hypothetical protein